MLDHRLILPIRSTLWEDVKKLAAEQDRSASSLIRDWIRDGLAAHTLKAREQDKALNPSPKKSRNGYLPLGEPDPNDPDNMTYIDRAFKGWSRAGVDRAVGDYFYAMIAVQGMSTLKAIYNRDEEFVNAIAVLAEQRKANGEVLFYYEPNEAGAQPEPVTNENLRLYVKHMELDWAISAQHQQSTIDRLSRELEEIEEDFDV